MRETVRHDQERTLAATNRANAATEQEAAEARAQVVTEAMDRRRDDAAKQQNVTERG